MRFSIAPLRADEDLLVRLAGHVDGDLDVRHVAALVEALDDDGHAVGHLLPRVLEDLLAHELRDEEAHRLVGERVRLEEERLLGQELAQLLEEALQCRRRAWR